MLISFFIRMLSSAWNSSSVTKSTCKNNPTCFNHKFYSRHSVTSVFIYDVRSDGYWLSWFSFNSVLTCWPQAKQSCKNKLSIPTFRVKRNIQWFPLYFAWEQIRKTKLQVARKVVCFLRSFMSEYPRRTPFIPVPAKNVISLSCSTRLWRIVLQQK